MKLTYKNTITSCFVAYIVQAVIINFIPMLFVTLQNSYDISLSEITLLVTINFIVQLLVDFLSAFFVDKIGYRTAMVLAHAFSAAGLIFMTILPEILPSPYIGLFIAVIVYAIGGGLLEVLINPIMESCPTDNKEKAMSMLHSFYSWGYVGVVLLSTLFFRLAGIENWKILAWIWALIPIVNGIVFLKTPIAPLISEGEREMSMKELFVNKVFWYLVVIMICAGACEHSICQWASTFAERDLGISKTLGDLVGPMTFAVLMGVSRVFYGKFGDKINLDVYMCFSGILCVIAYLMISLSPVPIIGVIGCALCGLSVGIMWPGSISKAAVLLRNGGTAMFALLALAGDVGCSAGPTLVGMVSSAFDDNLKIGIMVGIVFPIVMVISLLPKRQTKK